MENYKQVINDTDLVCVATKDQLNKKFWKRQNRKAMHEFLEIEKKTKKQIMELMPYFDITVMEYEVKYRKNRRNFNIIQKEHVNKVFKDRYKEKIIEVLGEEGYKKWKNF